MEIPKDVKVYENPTSFFWFDTDGILYSITKPDAPILSDEENQKQIDFFINLCKGEKVCMLIDAKHAKSNTPKERKRAAEVLPKVTKAMAIIVHNALGRMIVNLFIGLEKPQYPMKIFKPGEEEKAKKWLKTYL